VPGERMVVMAAARPDDGDMPQEQLIVLAN
jgi:hypothetical protein